MWKINLTFFIFYSFSTFSHAAEVDKLPNELLFRIGNESNFNDGLFGPFTYGFQGSHTFGNQYLVEAKYIRLHEPKSLAYKALTDELQLTTKSPEFKIEGQTLVISATAWKNRLIDMYTNVGGIEFTRVDHISLIFGIYLGTATLDDENDQFIGAQVGAQGSLGPIEVSLIHMAGRINPNGYYQKTGLDFSMNLDILKNLPTNFTFTIEDRHFEFGDGKPSSNPSDALIFISGLEIKIGELWFH